MKLFNSLFLITAASVIVGLINHNLPSGIPVGLWCLTAVAFGRMLLSSVSEKDINMGKGKIGGKK